MNKLKALKGKIDITRPNRSDGVDVISIVVRDELSGSRFLEIEMSPHDFMMALTGLSSQPVIFESKNLDVVGKKREYVAAVVDIPKAEVDGGYGKEVILDWLVKNQQREGWQMDTYLGSQSSVTRVDDIVYVRYGYYRYVDQEPA